MLKRGRSIVKKIQFGKNVMFVWASNLKMCSSNRFEKQGLPVTLVPAENPSTEQHVPCIGPLRNRSRTGSSEKNNSIRILIFI